MSRKNEVLASYAREIGMLKDRVAELLERNNRFAAEIDKAIAEHTPHPDAERLRPGNTITKVRFICDVCSTPWPCKPMNRLRRIYGEAQGWPPARMELPVLEWDPRKDMVPF